MPRVWPRYEFANQHDLSNGHLSYGFDRYQINKSPKIRFGLKEVINSNDDWYVRRNFYICMMETPNPFESRSKIEAVTNY